MVKSKKQGLAHQNLISDSEWSKIRKFGQSVREARLDKGWTLEQIELHGYKSWKHWQDIESGNRNINFTTILRIARVLKVKPADLLGDI